MRLSNELERVFVKDRTDLARMIGYLLGCHQGHSFFINADTLSIDFNMAMLTCIENSEIGYVFNLDAMPILKPHAPRPPF